MTLFRLAAFSVLTLSASFYLPGIAPNEFKKDDKIDIKVNSLTSADVFTPFDYYSLPFCKPDVVVAAAENIGELLTGNRIENSLYSVNMLDTKTCSLLCPPRLYNAAELALFTERIKERYHVNLVMDNMPAVSNIEFKNGLGNVLTSLVKGYPLGAGVVDETSSSATPSSYVINNHISISVSYHTSPEYPGMRIVEFVVTPYSIQHANLMNLLTATSLPAGACDVEDVMYIDGPEATAAMAANGGNIPIAWTYDVDFVSSEVAWASRWDLYLHMDSALMDVDKVHWISITNSLLIVVFLTGMIAIILRRTLMKDLSRYNRVPTEEDQADIAEETGWKLVHADVFRPPRYSMMFCIATGTGVQIVMMIVITIVVACFGFLSPANRGALMIALLVLFVFMAVPAGYTGARLYKSFGGKSWHRSTLLIAFLYPGILFGCFFTVNLALWIDGSVGAVPFSSMFAVLALWLGISVPLCFLGAVRGYKLDAIEFPVSVSSIPKDIPKQKWYMSTLMTGLMGGILPFGSVSVEIFFIMESLWLDRVYYMFGFLLLVFIILLVTCIEISIVMNYFQLCSEDYRWWWRSMTTPGFAAVYLWLYSVWFFSTRNTEVLFVSTLVYFVYMTLISFSFFLATGSIGVISCLIFNRSIYGAIKVD